MKVGNKSVVSGRLPDNTEVGDYSVVIGPTDNNGNTIINSHNCSMAIGPNARAGQNSIAIGANAWAGHDDTLDQLLNKLDAFVRSSNDPEIANIYGKLNGELTSPERNTSKVIFLLNELLMYCKKIGPLVNVLGLITQIAQLFK